MPDIENIVQRKENIEAIEPFLSALRTISLANWKFSLTKLEQTQNRRDKLDAIFQKVIENSSLMSRPFSEEHNKLFFIVGSTRGICGDFDNKIIDFFNAYQEDNLSNSKLILIGSRIGKSLPRDRFPHVQYEAMPTINTLSLQYIHHLLNHAGAVLHKDEIYFFFNQYQGSSKFGPSLHKFMPTDFILKKQKSFNADIIIDSDPLQLIQKIQYYQWINGILFTFYSSFASENFARFSILENAEENTESLLKELNILIQEERKNKITSEMQELAVAAGLIQS